MRLGLPDLVSNSYFPAIAAVELGYFSREGLNVEIVHLFPIARAMAALRDGELDFVAGSAHDALLAFPQWSGARLLAALSQRMYWLLVLRSTLGVARGNLAAIRGLRIAAAPGPEAGFRQLLRAAGLDADRDGVRLGPLAGPLSPGASFGVAAAAALEAGEIDGFWANAMAAQVAVNRGVGTVVLDVRRGDGPPAAWSFTFPALTTTEHLFATQPASAVAAVRAIVRTQRLLREQPSRATEAAQRLFPAAETALIAGLIERDAPYLTPEISEQTVMSMNDFAQSIGLLEAPVAYDQIVPTTIRQHWDT